MLLLNEQGIPVQPIEACIYENEIKEIEARITIISESANRIRGEEEYSNSYVNQYILIK